MARRWTGQPLAVRTLFWLPALSSLHVSRPRTQPLTPQPFFLAGKALSFSWDIAHYEVGLEAATSEVEEEDNDPFGVAALEADFEKNAPRIGARKRLCNVDEVAVGSYVIVRAAEDTGESEYVFELGDTDVPLWLGKVQKVEEDEDGVLMWSINWHAPISRNKAAKKQRTACSAESTGQPAHQAPFYAQRGPGTTSQIEADEDVLVTVFAKLNNDNRIPDKVKKAALPILKDAGLAHDNGNVQCVLCNVADDKEVAACDCCSRKFHVHCAGDQCKSGTWWCPSCEEEVA